MSKGVRIQIYNVPKEWVEILKKTAQQKGLSLSDFLKAFVIQPYVEKIKQKIAEVEE